MRRLYNKFWAWWMFKFWKENMDLEQEQIDELFNKLKRKKRK